MKKLGLSQKNTNSKKILLNFLKVNKCLIKINVNTGLINHWKYPVIVILGIGAKYETINGCWSWRSSVKSHL